jgi:hypothetical protein
LNVFRKGKDEKQETGTLDKVVIRNVKAKAAANAQLIPPSGILITGVPGHDITDVTLENIEIDLSGGGNTEHARQTVPEAIDKYPEVKTFGPVIPAYGIWARHVSGLKLNNIRFTLAQNDLRPVFVCEDGKDIELNNWHIPETSGAQAILRLENVTDAQISKMEVKGIADSFVLVEGDKSSNIRLSKNKIPGIKKEIAVSTGAINEHSVVR